MNPSPDSGRMSPEQRRQIEAKLRRFDQVLTPEQQKALRAIDDRIGKLPSEEGQHYLAVLRRYHNWLNSLPETVKTNYLSRPASERIAQIKSLIARYPIPTGISPRWIWFADGGSASLIEQAAIFKVWKEMTPEQRREVENPPAGKRRPSSCSGTLEATTSSARSSRPTSIEEEWTTKAESALREIIVLDPGGAGRDGQGKGRDGQAQGRPRRGHREGQA